MGIIGENGVGILLSCPKVSLSLIHISTNAAAIAVQAHVRGIADAVLPVQAVLQDAGYHLNRKDGIRYPSYVRLDSNGRRIRGDKFIVTDVYKRQA